MKPIKRSLSAWQLGQLSVLAAASLAFPVQSAEPAPAAAAASAPKAETPLQSLPYTPSLDLSAMDRSVNPCENLHQFACGGWMKNNPIPDDQARWSVYAKVANENQRYLWGILDKLAQAPQGADTRTASQAKIGDYFAACMNEEAANAAGLAPLQPLLAKAGGKMLFPKYLTREQQDALESRPTELCRVMRRISEAELPADR